MQDIIIHNMTKTYPGNSEPALKNFNLHIQAGTIVSLLGPSGCGKSTILRLVAGFERADTGTIQLGDTVVSDRHIWTPAEKRGVGMVFQDYALFPHLNVYQNIGFGYKGTDCHSRIQEVIELVNLKGLENRFPNALSGGQQQRVALARALTRRPVVVLMDEPFSSLDEELRMQMRIEIKRIIKESGTTAIFVTHDQKDAITISDQVVVMDHGMIQQVGSPRDIYQSPENLFVANFVGRTNLLRGVVHRERGTVETVIGELPIGHIHHDHGEAKVHVSLRPEGLFLDPNGPIIGCIINYTYMGSSIDAEIQVRGTDQILLTHMHSDQPFQVGDLVHFDIMSGYVSVFT
ncbi:MAG: ABC transporter ATP-binding protein [Firmicutes bacterium HGW-Firmicutes-2]|nr:MAG: ABC transporter ATP-binding protein [Firmicutes bacterium HGW-Firmicutes-2]